MQIDVTKGKPSSNYKKNNKRLQPKTKEIANKSSIKYYSYSKKGYYKNEYNAQKQHYKLQNSRYSKNRFRTTKSKTIKSVKNTKISDEIRTKSIRVM